jgi:hypothetical protein
MLCPRGLLLSARSHFIFLCKLADNVSQVRHEALQWFELEEVWKATLIAAIHCPTKANCIDKLFLLGE